MERLRYFRDNVQETTEPLSDTELADLVVKYVAPRRSEFQWLTYRRCIHRDSEEIAQLQQERRKGRPPVRREEALKERTQTEENEFKTGFWLPDLSDADVLEVLKNWSGHWSGLSSMKFIRLLQDGGKQSSSFPPKGMS